MSSYGWVVVNGVLQYSGGVTVSSGEVFVDGTTTLSAETLENPNLTSGTDWTQTGDMALAANAATYTHATGAGTLSQAAVDLAVIGGSYKLYKFVYTISAVSGAAPTATITTAFANAAQSLTTGVNGTYTLYFRSAINPGAFTISVTSAGAGAFTIDTFSLKESVGGLEVTGTLTAGALSVLGASTFFGSTTFTSAGLFADGLVTAPSIAFANDASNDSGFYLIGANNIGAAAGGAIIWDWNSSRLKLASGITLDWNTTVIDATDIAKIDAITNGTGAAAKALVLNADADITAGLRAVTQTYSGIAATSTDGHVIQNATASTAGVPVQQSPRLRLRSNVWNTTVVATNNTDDWIIESVPVSGATPSGLLKFGSSLNGAAYTFPTTLTNAGVLAVSTAVAIGATVPTSGALRLETNTGIVSGTGGGTSLMYFKSTNSTIRMADSGSVVEFAGSATVLGTLGGAASVYKVVKKVTAIADNVATTVFTVTVPNAAHAASIKLRFLSYNGDTDSHESSRTAEGTVVLARTAGVTTVATVVAISDEAIATVAAGATHTLAYSATAMTGAAGATQTFDIQVTIDDSGNLGSNAVVAIAELINAEATGVTIS